MYCYSNVITAIDKKYLLHMYYTTMLQHSIPICTPPGEGNTGMGKGNMRKGKRNMGMGEGSMGRGIQGWVKIDLNVSTTHSTHIILPMKITSLNSDAFTWLH